MRNNWESRKRGYLIRFGHTEALLLKKNMTLNGHFSRPAETDPYGDNTLQKGASPTGAPAVLKWTNSAQIVTFELVFQFKAYG